MTNYFTNYLKYLPYSVQNIKTNKFVRKSTRLKIINQKMLNITSFYKKATPFKLENEKKRLFKNKNEDVFNKLRHIERDYNI